MIHEHQNYSLTDPAGIDSGDTLVECNLAQQVPGTAILLGRRNLTFTRCNLVNCALPPDSVILDCNTAQVDFLAALAVEDEAAVELAWRLNEIYDAIAPVVGEGERIRVEGNAVVVEISPEVPL